MKIGIYAPYLAAYGGGEKYVCKIAEILAKENRVELLVLERPSYNEIRDRLYIDLSNVGSKQAKISNVFRKVPYLRGLARIHAVSEASKEYDLFINQEHFSPIPSLAKRGILICEVPPTRLNTRLFNNLVTNLLLDPKLKTYDKIVVNSLYTKKWAESYYARQVEVLYPPIDTKQFLSLSKENIILSVGRFFAEGHCKKQLEMITAFKRLYTGSETIRGWEYHLVGGIGSSDKDQEYLRRCQDEAQNYPVYFHINIPFKLLKELYGRAKIFWHATGLGEDEDRHPDRMEHFGMTTLEAMSAGCVPIVINKGGQPEIIINGTTGFLFETSEELKEYTLKLINDDVLWGKMSGASIERSKEFDMEKFEKRVRQVFEL